MNTTGVQFVFTITPPVYAIQCVRNYLVTSTDSDGNRRDISVELSKNTRDQVIVRQIDGFDLCSSSYSFTVVANTLAGIGENSEVVNIPGMTFTLQDFICVCVCVCGGGGGGGGGNCTCAPPGYFVPPPGSHRG